MTRINIIPVKELCNKHLLAEWREMPRLIGSLNKSLNRKSKPFNLSEIPNQYVLGKGHVKFFYDKFRFLHKRHIELTNELLFRGFNLNTADSSIFNGVPSNFYNDYTPTSDAIELNKHRIQEKMPNNPKYTLTNK